MCIKLLSKTLNPKAQEWRPAPKQPRPPPLAAALDHMSTPFHYPSHRPLYDQGFIHYNVYTQCRPIYHHVPFLATETHFEALKTKSCNSEKKKKTEGRGVKSPKCPPEDVHASKQGFKRVYPPRIKRLVGCSRADSYSPTPPSPPAKQEWKPKKTAKAGCEVSGEGGATHPPPRPLHSGNTTVMIKNIPNQLRRDFMLKFLDDYCKTYSLEYDFFYLPMDFRKMDNLGYAFVNFTSIAAAQKFKNILQNYKWGTVYYAQGLSFVSKKVCDITWARIQGQKALMERFQKSSFACDRLDFLPVIFDPPCNGSDLNPSLPVTLGSLQA